MNTSVLFITDEEYMTSNHHKNMNIEQHLNNNCLIDWH